ncbi:MAG: hypothetical protein IJK99_09435 [Bacteroidales bacterium]|nr:hypothetical protein [Bacteroidales bacterium]
MPETQTVKERLIFFLEQRRVSKKRFGESIGMSSSYVDSIRRSISPEILEKIMDEYPDLNPVWLLTGRGDWLVRDETAASSGPAVSQYNIHNNHQVNIGDLNAKLDSILEEVKQMREERQRYLAIIENLSRQ